LTLKRKRISSVVDPELWEKLQKLSKETRVPVAQYLDEAIEDLLKKYQKGELQPIKIVSGGPVRPK
jgi:predicted DNA-binding protein